MRKHSKIVTAIAGVSAAVAVSGVAYAYWTTSGSGSGTGSTTAGTVDKLTYTQNPAGIADTPVALTAMYPGDASQSLTVRVRNTSTESAYVPSVKVWISTDKAGCDATDFKLNGAQSSAVDQASAQSLTWTAADLAAGAAANATGSIQFFDKPLANQDLCKGAAVTLHYFTPVTPLPTTTATP